VIAEPAFLKDSTFDLKRSEADEALFRVNKKNEEFQELLDEEFERLNKKQQSSAPLFPAGSSEPQALTAQAEEPNAYEILAGSGDGLSVIEARIQDYLRRADEKIAFGAAQSQSQPQPQPVTKAPEMPTFIPDVAVQESTPAEVTAAAEAEVPVIPDEILEEAAATETPTAAAAPTDGYESIEQLEEVIAAEGETVIPDDISEVPTFTAIPENPEREERRNQILNDLFGEMEEPEEEELAETTEPEPEPEVEPEQEPDEPDEPEVPAEPEEIQEPPEKAPILFDVDPPKQVEKVNEPIVFVDPSEYKAEDFGLAETEEEPEPEEPSFTKGLEAPLPPAEEVDLEAAVSEGLGLGEDDSASALAAFAAKSGAEVGKKPASAEEIEEGLPKKKEGVKKQKPKRNIKAEILSGFVSALLTVAVILVVAVIACLLLVKFAPDSVGAFYVRDFVEMVKSWLGIGG
jgi:hypothetical protein